MRFATYPNYRDSGIGSVSELPAHWNRLPLKRLGTIRYGIGEPPEYRDDGIPLIRATNVRSGIITPVGLVFVDPSDIPVKRIVWLQGGDIVVVRSGAGTGDSAIIPSDYGPAIAGFDMVLRCERADAWFVQYVLLSSYLRQGQIDLEKMRAAQPHLNAEELGECDIILPPEKEQTQIANFLDYETAKIAALIEKQQQLIALLNEKRQAVISHAVTKGLNPDAPMRDSGVEWLGEVPAHWEVWKISHLMQLRSGETLSAEQFDSSGTYPVYGGNGLRGFFTEYNHVGDYILVGRQGALCGNINYGQGKFWATEHALVVHQQQKLDIKWLGETLRTMNLNQYSVSAAQPGLSVSNITCLKVPVPPKKEQENIAIFIKAETRKTDDISDRANEAIELLQERRTALIAAAVTGKIDVRGWNAPKSQTEADVA